MAEIKKREESPMNLNEILAHPLEWKSITRAEAVRKCAIHTVVVVSKAMGAPTVAAFHPGGRFYSATGPYDYSSLHYYLKAEPTRLLKGMGGGRKTPPRPRKGSGPASPYAASPTWPWRTAACCITTAG